jgi:hypothetical protein
MCRMGEPYKLLPHLGPPRRLEERNASMSMQSPALNLRIELYSTVRIIKQA